MSHPHESEAGLYRRAAGKRPNRVAVREEIRGANVVLDYRDPVSRRRVKQSLGYGVRNKQGRIVTALDDRAYQAAQDRSDELRLDRLRESAVPTRLTVGSAFKLFHDPVHGGLPEGEETKRSHRRARAFWEMKLKPGRPWNAIRRAHITAALKGLIRDGMVASAEVMLKRLRTLYRWLDEEQEIEGLKNPTKGVRWVKLKPADYKARRPRYTAEEVVRLLAARSKVDPRYALFLALIDDSGARSKATRLLMRSAIDRRLDVPFTPEQAPYGWVVFPPMKGQPRIPSPLTLEQRIALSRAIWKRWDGERWVAGYLSELDREYRATGKDYPLFPGRRKGQGEVVQPRANLAPVGARYCRQWLVEAERAAKVAHIEARGWHGLRRAVSDYLYREIGLDKLTTAMGWTDRRTPESIYLEAEKYKDRVAARVAHERKHELRNRPETSPQVSGEVSDAPEGVA